MSITQSSIFCRFFAALGALLRQGWAFLVESWQDSLPGRAAARIGLAIRRGVGGSGVCQFLWRDGVLVRAWSGSLACRFFTGLINLPTALLHWLYRRFQSVWDGSLAFRFVSALGGGAYLFLGFSLLLLLIVPHANWNNGYALRCLLLVLLLFLAGAMARPRRTLALDRMGPYYLLFLGFLVYGYLASLGTDFSQGILYGLFSEAKNLSVRFFIFHIIAFLITILTVSAVQRIEELQLLLAIVLTGLVVASLYGCYQGYQGVEVVASQQDMILNAGMPGRIYSFFDNPNNFAEILVMLMPFLLALLLNAKTWGGRVLSLLSLIPCVAAIGMTLSRSGWIGLVIAVAVFLMLLNWRFLPVFLVLGVAAIPFLPESIFNRILTIGNMQDSSTRYRFAIYQDTTYLIRDYGLRGVGLGTDVMRQVFKVYPTMFDGNYPIHTHNNYLQMWGELGFFGALTYLCMVLRQAKMGVKAFYSGTNRMAKNILAAAVGAFCGISVIGVAEYTWFYPRNMFLYFFLFGVITAAARLARKKAA